MVKPMPASIPTPNICFQLAPDGNLARFILTANQENSVTPIVFPKKSPKIIPKPNGEVKPSIISFWKVMLVFAKAKIGIIKKLTGTVKKCSNFSNGDGSAVSLVGMVNANKTPAIVACIPE